MNNGDQRSSLGGHNNQLSGFKVLHSKFYKIWPDLEWPKFSESCKLEIWSGDNFTGNRADCTGACDISHLGSVGNDRARSAKCTCEAKPLPKTTRELKTNTIFGLKLAFQTPLVPRELKSSTVMLTDFNVLINIDVTVKII